MKYANLKYIPTWKIECILNHPHYQGIDGKDYGPVAHELISILHERKQRMAEWEQKKRELGLDAAIRAMSAEVPPIPAEADEGLDAAIVEEYMVLKNSFSKVAIPPQILAF